MKAKGSPPTRRPRGTVSLERALSKRGLASRTDARALILAGRVRLDGRVVTQPGLAVVPETMRVEIDGTTANDPGEQRLIAFHKPRGVVTTRRDPEGRKTVFDVLGDAGAGLIAVGRLDLASTGLLLLTNDTQFANALTDPVQQVPRRYVVSVRGRVSDDEARSLSDGINVQGTDGRRQHLAASGVAILKASGRESHLEIELREGRNREIRRLFEAIGHEVTRLHRIAFGPIVLGDLQPGAWREEAFFLESDQGSRSRP